MASERVEGPCWSVACGARSQRRHSGTRVVPGGPQGHRRGTVWRYDRRWLSARHGGVVSWSRPGLGCGRVVDDGVSSSSDSPGEDPGQKGDLRWSSVRRPMRNVAETGGREPPDRISSGHRAIDRAIESPRKRMLGASEHQQHPTPGAKHAGDLVDCRLRLGPEVDVVHREDRVDGVVLEREPGPVVDGQRDPLRVAINVAFRRVASRSISSETSTPVTLADRSASRPTVRPGPKPISRMDSPGAGANSSTAASLTVAVSLTHSRPMSRPPRPCGCAACRDR